MYSRSVQSISRRLFCLDCNLDAEMLDDLGHSTSPMESLVVQTMSIMLLSQIVPEIRSPFIRTNFRRLGCGYSAEGFQKTAPIDIPDATRIYGLTLSDLHPI